MSKAKPCLTIRNKSHKRRFLPSLKPHLPRPLACWLTLIFVGRQRHRQPHDRRDDGGVHAPQVRDVGDEWRLRRGGGAGGGGACDGDEVDVVEQVQRHPM